MLRLASCHIGVLALSQFLAFNCLASGSFGLEPIEHVRQKQWASQQLAAKQTKLLPQPAGIGGPDSYFGGGIAIEGDRAIAGAATAAAWGAVYVLQFNGSEWIEAAVLMPADGVSQYFGYAISLEGDRVLVGAPLDDNENGADAGSVYIFDYDGKSWNQTTKLIAADAGSNRRFGTSVGLSGGWLVVGAFGDSSNGIDSGAAYVFAYDGTRWGQTVKLNATDGEANDFFGYSVSISAQRVLVGALQDDDIGGDSGSAYVFDYDGANWGQTAKLTATDGNISARFGSSVSLSGDRALLGAYGSGDNGFGAGAAYIFEFDGNSWSQTAKLLAADGAAGNNFGRYVDLLGNRVVVAARYDDDQGTGSGSAYIFDYTGSAWAQTAKLVAADGAAFDEFGYFVGLSANRVLVGAPYDQDYGVATGSAYVFDHNNGQWTQSAKLVAAEGASDNVFGVSVSLSGTRAAVGAPGDTNSGSSAGSVYIYDYTQSGWSETVKLAVNDGAEFAIFGSSISLVGDQLLVGGRNGDAYIFDNDGNSWSQTIKLTTTRGSAGDSFGISVSLAENRALVGALRDDDQGMDAGAAYVFDNTGGVWNETTKLIAIDGEANDGFGLPVSVSGDRALVAAHYDDDLGEDSGSVYVFEYDGRAWIQMAKLTAADGEAGDQFGSSVSLFGDRALIGSRNDDDQGAESGSAYIFEYDGSNWSQSAKLTAADGKIRDAFGNSASLKGDRALIGAYHDDAGGANSGSAYVFDYDGSGGWAQTAKLIATDSGVFDYFGTAVSLSGDRVLVGAYGDNDHGKDSGSAYVIFLGLFVDGFED